MTINATYGRYILEPLLRFQNAGTGTPYAIPDLGVYIMCNHHVRNFEQYFSGYSYPRVGEGLSREFAQPLGVEGVCIHLTLLHDILLISKADRDRKYAVDALGTSTLHR